MPDFGAIAAVRLLGLDFCGQNLLLLAAEKWAGFGCHMTLRQVMRSTDYTSDFLARKAQPSQRHACGQCIVFPKATPRAIFRKTAYVERPIGMNTGFVRIALIALTVIACAAIRNFTPLSTGFAEFFDFTAHFPIFHPRLSCIFCLASGTLVGFWIGRWTKRRVTYGLPSADTQEDQVEIAEDAMQEQLVSTFARASTFLSVTILVLSIIPLTWLKAERIAEYGEYFGAIFSSIALTWLASGFWLQRLEFRHQRSSLNASWSIHDHELLLSLKPDFLSQLSDLANQIMTRLYSVDDITVFSNTSKYHTSDIEFPSRFLLARPDVLIVLQKHVDQGDLLPATLVNVFLQRYSEFELFVRRASKAGAKYDPMLTILLLGNPTANLFYLLKRASDKLTAIVDVDGQEEDTDSE